MQPRRVLITAGGTGGHLYPAQALAEELLTQSLPLDILFVAGGLKKNRCFDSQQFSFEEIACSPLLSLNPLKCARGVKNLVKGVAQSIQILREYRPDVVVGFGSYYTVPTLLAAKWVGIPIVLHEANSVPGRANQWLAPLATYVGVHFPSTASFFKNKSIEVALPLRKELRAGTISKEEALAHYGLAADRHTLLICGGSQGAAAINVLIEQCLPCFKRLSLQVIHLTGEGAESARLTALYAAHEVAASVKAFEHEMQFAWAAADAFVGRCGASTLAESMEFEVPGILIPYPHATAQHQEKNADFLVGTVQAGWKYLEEKLSAPLLGEAIEQLFQAEQMLRFKQALSLYKQRPDQLTLCQLILRHFSRRA